MTNSQIRSLYCTPYLPMTVRTTRDFVHGVEVFGLQNDHIHLEVIPELGAKISRVHDLQAGREWLWTDVGNTGFGPRQAGIPYDDANLGGIDECIPTITPCQWREANLPDHGEVWSEPWSIDEAAFANQILTTHLKLPISPLRFQRSVTLHGREVRLDYTLENLSSHACEYVWACHPLFSIEEGDRIELPADCSRVYLDHAVGCLSGPMGTEYSWPEPEPGVHLDHLHFGQYSNAAIKLFTEPLSIGYAAIRNDRTGAQLALHFDTRLNDTLGIWLSRGGLKGYHHLALEPTNGAPDSLEIAVTQWKRFTSLAPGEKQEWTLRMVVSHATL